jgi:hypothetical protein
MNPQKNLNLPFFVIPAEAGIQFPNGMLKSWTPVFTGVTTICRIINIV